MHLSANAATGGVRCWGYRYYGQLGDGNGGMQLTPTPVQVVCQ